MARAVARTVEGDQALDQLIARPKLIESVYESGLFKVELWRRRKPNQKPKLIETFYSANLVTDQGLSYKRDAALLAGTPITAWYLMLLNASPTIVAADTYASHAGFAEFLNYDEATRRPWNGVATVTAGEASNASSVAEFTIGVAGGNVGGAAFVGGGSAPSTKGDTAGGGKLLSASAFTGGNRSLQEDDLLRITYIQRSSRP